MFVHAPCTSTANAYLLFWQQFKQKCIQQPANLPQKTEKAMADGNDLVEGELLLEGIAESTESTCGSKYV